MINWLIGEPQRAASSSCRTHWSRRLLGGLVASWSLAGLCILVTASSTSVGAEGVHRDDWDDSALAAESCPANPFRDDVQPFEQTSQMADDFASHFEAPNSNELPPDNPFRKEFKAIDLRTALRSTLPAEPSGMSFDVPSADLPRSGYSGLNQQVASEGILPSNAQIHTESYCLDANLPEASSARVLEQLVTSTLNDSPLVAEQCEADSLLLVTDESTALPADAPNLFMVGETQSDLLLHPYPLEASPTFDETMLNKLSVDIRPRKVFSNKASADVESEAVEYVAQGDLPKDASGASLLGSEFTFASENRGFACREFAWAAPSFYHRPLYFEQTNLERYGHFYGGACTQSVISTAHFFANVPILSYKFASQSPRKCVFTLGNYRPGNCNPHYWTPNKFSAKGLAAQALSSTGTAFLLY